MTSHFFTKKLSLQLGIKPGVSVVMTHSGATLSEMIRIQLLLLHFSDIAKDVVVAATVRVCAHNALYQCGGVLLLGALFAAYI